MFEKAKIEEAEYFLSKMREEVNKPGHFQYVLSAFLTAARSVLQYTLEEAKKKTGGQAWHDQMMATSPALKFFRDKRDVNIHEEPVSLSTGITTGDRCVIGLGESVTVVKRDAEGKVIETITSPQSSPHQNLTSPPSMAPVTYRYLFPDWNGQEDVLNLSEKYIQELKVFVQDGINQNFISG